MASNFNLLPLPEPDGDFRDTRYEPAWDADSMQAYAMACFQAYLAKENEAKTNPPGA